ncbi:MAG TPA: amidohydrolase family protein [Acidimicrobiia bacterium]|nr:amidohydrolase family protein [Acidimicrobiia bacterium]
MSGYLIRGGCVISMDQKVGNHLVGDVLIQDDRIVEVGSNLRARNAEVVDASDAIVMPGFVDSHRHVWESLFRGLGDLAGSSDPAPLLGPHYSADDVYAATLIGLLGAVEAGITSVADWADIRPEHVPAALQAHADAAVRTVFAPAGASWSEDGDWQAASVAVEESPLLTAAAGPPVPLQDLARLSAEWGRARQSNLRIHAHSGTDPSQRGEVAGAADLLDADVTLVHCSSLGESDFDAVAAAGASVALAPSSEMAKGHEPPPMQRLIDRHIRPGLAVDTERLAPGDLFAPMRAAISIQHATHFDLKLAGKGGLPTLLTTREVIRYATIDGARAIGLGHVTGSLTPGKQADVIVLRADRPNIAPINDPIGAVVWGMDTSNLDWVFVAGQPRMRHGIVEADLSRVRSLASEAHRRVASAAGILTGAGVEA